MKSKHKKKNISPAQTGVTTEYFKEDKLLTV